MQYDVFNGDADGIFALHQLRLAHPVTQSNLITGVKRDISLLDNISNVHSSTICVFDISLDKNRDALLSMLKNGNTILYIDHHYPGSIPNSKNLVHHIEPSAETCTAMIVNQLLNGQYAKWAICGAFGDNLHEQATKLAADVGMSTKELDILKEIGEFFNYNGYGAKIEDLLFHPAELYQAVKPYPDPHDFYHSTDLVLQLRDGYQEDMAKALDQKDISTYSKNRLYRFPSASWSRRIVGVFSNLKAREKENAAHAIIVENEDSTFQISVRAPLKAKKNADLLCRKFPTGGGRAAAAGINHLPAEMLDEFIETFHSIYREENFH